MEERGNERDEEEEKGWGRKKEEVNLGMGRLDIVFMVKILKNNK